MADWTSLNEIEADIPIEPELGDLWRSRDQKVSAHVTDVLPFSPRDEKPKPITRVGALFVQGAQQKHDWIAIEDFRKRYTFRRRA